MHQIVTKCAGSPEATEKILHRKSGAYSSQEYKEVAEHYKEKCFNWHETKVKIPLPCCKCRRVQVHRVVLHLFTRRLLHFQYRSAMEHLYLFANLLEEKVAVER